MVENGRYKIVGSDDFFQHIEDTTLTEDKHEGSIYNLQEVVNKLNEQDESIRENEQIIERLYVFFLKWFEEERGTNPTDFSRWWCSIGLGETIFENYEW